MINYFHFLQSNYLCSSFSFCFIQVQWNLFSATSLVCDTKEGNKQTARAFTPWVEIEDNYRKYGSQDEFSMKPRFYNLSRTDFNNQDAPKLDGLVCFGYGLVKKQCFISIIFMIKMIFNNIYLF